MNYQEGRRRGNATVDRKALEMAINFSGMSKDEIARRAGLSPSTISNLLHTRKTCSAETAGKLAKTLKQPTHALFVLNVFTGNYPVNVSAPVAK